MRNVKYGVIPFAIAAVIFYLCCLIPPKDVPGIKYFLGLPFDKVAHFVMYLGFAAATAAYYVYDRRGYINIPLMLVGAGLVPILYGGVIELVQDNFFPPRAGEWGDFLADTLGVLAAMPTIFAFKRFIINRTPKM
jgi:VanZ family protein